MGKKIKERWIAVADLHGHLDEFEALLGFADREYGEDYRLCTLGDYVDNGPRIPALLDRLIDLKKERTDRFVPIIGNHDLSFLRALGFPGTEPDEIWWDRWSSSHWNGGGETPFIYAKQRGEEAPRSAKDLALLFPVGDDHRAFLESLPWVHEAGDYVFVHAGMREGPLEPQIQSLLACEVPENPRHHPPQVRDKSLSLVCDPDWDRTVVSAHTKNIDGPCFTGPNRICLKADVDSTGVLRAVVLPERRWLSVERHGSRPLVVMDEVDPVAA